MTHYTHVRGFEFSLIGSCGLRIVYTIVAGLLSLSLEHFFKSISPEENTDPIL